MTETKLPGRPPVWASVLFDEVRQLRTSLAKERVYPKLVTEQAPVVTAAPVDGERLSRGQVVVILDETVLAGMPAFDDLHLSESISFSLSTEADLRSWLAWLGAKDERVSGQPYPGLSDPSKATTWMFTAVTTWNGWTFVLDARDPITDAQRQQWIDSGKAAVHAKLEAAQEAKAASLAEAV